MVGSDAFYHEPFIVLGEAFCSHGRVREEPENKPAPKDGEGAVGDEYGLITSNDLVPPNQGKAVREKASYDLLCSVHHVPVCDDLGLFRAFVPDGTHNEESRLANSLEDTEERSDGDESWETEAH